MAFRIAFSLICCLVICLIRIKTAHAECYSSGNFTANSTYSKNRDTIIASLASNAAANDGFYNSSVGHGSDKVYALAMCRGDLSKTQCYTCVNSNFYSLLSDCPIQYEALSWNGDCVIHYANKSIYGVLEMNPTLALFKDATISWNSAFNQTWSGLMEKLKNQAAGGSSKLKYAAGKENFTLTQYIYGLVQCTPDLSEDDCDHCLTQNIADFERLYAGHQGGAVKRPGCIFGWDLCPFYSEVNSAPQPSPLLPPPPPSPLSSTGNGGLSAKTFGIIFGLAGFFIALVAVGLFIFCRQRRRRIMTVLQHVQIDEDVDISSEFLHLDFGTIRAATDNFSDNKKLGRGGFGTVYKGTFPNGQEIAVKRLSQNSQQGEQEFKTEVKLMTKLRHRNLVRLIGFSLEKEERVLVYEFLPNSSLDRYIFRKAALLFRLFPLATR
ncbi:hypothetical protein ACFE04_001895 [Oxalis oulophora]